MHFKAKLDHWIGLSYHHYMHETKRIKSRRLSDHSIIYLMLITILLVFVTTTAIIVTFTAVPPVFGSVQIDRFGISELYPSATII